MLDIDSWPYRPSKLIVFGKWGVDSCCTTSFNDEASFIDILDIPLLQSSHIIIHWLTPTLEELDVDSVLLDIVSRYLLTLKKLFVMGEEMEL